MTRQRRQHHQIQAPDGREGPSQPPDRLLRQHARSLVGRAAPGRGAGHLELAKGLRCEARGRQDPDQLRPGRTPPPAGLDRDLPGEPRGREHVR